MTLFNLKKTDEAEEDMNAEDDAIAAEEEEDGEDLFGDNMEE